MNWEAIECAKQIVAQLSDSDSCKPYITKFWSSSRIFAVININEQTLKNDGVRRK